MSRSIAIVSSHEDYITVMTELLAYEGYQVVACRTSEEACERIQQTQPALLLLDLWLEHPQAGELVLARLHHDPATQNTPVIICLEDPRYVESIEDVLREKRCAILFKPFDIDVLLAMIAEMSQPAATAQGAEDTMSRPDRASQVSQGETMIG